MSISKVIDSAVETINSSEKRKKSATEKLLPLKEKPLSQPTQFKENSLVFPIKKWVPQGLIAGVDSGFVAKR